MNRMISKRRYRLGVRQFFAVACGLSALTSGGLIARVGPFQAALVREGYFNAYSDVAAVFTGGFQIMTVLTCLGGIMLGAIGPRATAFTGTALALLGNVLIATARKGQTGVGTFIVGYGLIGGGGNGIWLASFPLVVMFGKGETGTATAVLASMWNIAGLQYMILGLGAMYSGVTIRHFFGVSIFWNVLVIFVVLLLYPDHTPEGEEKDEVDEWREERWEENRGDQHNSTLEETVSALQRENMPECNEEHGGDIMSGGFGGDADVNEEDPLWWVGCRTPRELISEAAMFKRNLWTFANCRHIKMQKLRTTDDNADGHDHEQKAEYDRQEISICGGIDCIDVSPIHWSQEWQLVLKDTRLWLFVLAFSTCALVTQILGGYGRVL